MKSIWTKLLILCLLPISLEVVTQMGVIQPAIAQFQLTPEEEAALAPAARSAIRQLVVQSQTRSGRPEPQVSRITIVGNYALASWTQGEAGGMRALEKKNAVWQLLPTVGGGVPDPENLSRRTGMPLGVAERLLSIHLTDPTEI
jgi:hypothetical protein